MMNNMSIITDNKWKFFKNDYDIPRKVYEDYDWLNEEQKVTGWIHYRKYWYHISDFQVIDPTNTSFPEKWDGYLCDSFFSGILIRLSKDGESYKIGLFLT